MAEQSILIVLPTGRTMTFRLLFSSDTANLGAANKMKENEGKSTLSKCITIEQLTVQDTLKYIKEALLSKELSSRVRNG